jgi:hypothetical protein
MPSTPQRGLIMRKLEDDYSPEQIQQMREEMDRLRESRLENEKKAQQAYEEMKRRNPEFWKAFGFVTEGEYLWYYDLHHVIKP